MSQKDGGSGGDSVAKAVLVAFLIAIATGGSAPWWWDRVFDHASSQPSAGGATSTASPTSPAPQSPTRTNPAKPSGGSSHSSGCSIVTTGVTELRRTKNPTTSGESMPVGDYDVRSIGHESWVGSDIQWFEITVDGRTGWVQDDPAEVASRSAGCP